MRLLSAHALPWKSQKLATTWPPRSNSTPGCERKSAKTKSRVWTTLGKQPVELEYLRFANQALAELWDRNSISEIHITMAEDFGWEDGSFTTRRRCPA